MADKLEWDGVTRVLHWGLTLFITFQLFSGLLVSTPGTLVYFHWHEYVGLAAAAVILVHWMWSFTRQDLGLLFPWNGAGFARVREEFVGMLQGRLPAAGPQVGLSSFIHGLGLLAMTVMGFTGVLLFLVIPQSAGGMAAAANPVAITSLSLIHRYMSYLAWLYWLGHVAFALLHQFRGGGVFGAIYLGRPERNPEIVKSKQA